MRTEQELTELYLRHRETAWNICYPFFLNRVDTEDAMQETFLRLMRSRTAFRDAAHEKAWLIVTARNVCRDELRRARRRDVPLDRAAELRAPEPEPDETMAALAQLPESYRTAIYLYYYEGYRTAQIARLLHRPDATIRSDLRRGRRLLKELLGGTK